MSKEHERSHGDKRNFKEKLFVTGSNSIIYPFKVKLKPYSAYAKFIDAECVHLPGCNPVVKDKVHAEIVVLPDGAHGVRVSWHVAHTREIEWHVIECLF